jgi:hemerythrin-like domain-containing protein
MNSSTKNLEDDHIYVLKLTEVMRAVTKNPAPAAADVENIIDIIRNFADGLHHAKEEDLLFPLLAKKGLSPQQGPVAVMLFEHEQGRNFVKGMAENLDSYKKGAAGAVAGIFTNLSGYADLLTSHISKENNILFRMADKVLSEEEQTHLSAEFDKIEKQRGEGSRAADYINRINALASKYNI